MRGFAKEAGRGARSALHRARLLADGLSGGNRTVPPFSDSGAEPQAGRGLLPPGDYYALTWAIPPHFGGMTTALLERSNAFAELDERTVQILTLSDDVLIGHCERLLRAKGRLGPRVRLRNLWHDLRSRSDEELARLAGPAERGTDPGAVAAAPRALGRHFAARRDASGRVVAAYHYRLDGRLQAADAPDPSKPEDPDAHSVTLFDTHGKPIGRWERTSAFYEAWLDAVIGGRQAVLVSDAKSVGALVHDYRRPRTVTCHVLHNPHLKDDARGELRSGRHGAVRHLDDFDVAVTLTERQRSDLLEAHLSAGRVAAVPNAISDADGDPDAPREPTAGVMVARLAPQKRIGDAIGAIALCRDEPAAPHLEVYGSGVLRDRLRERIGRLGVTELVRLHGHRPDAKQAFLTASFSLLTSKFEGQGLVLLESMSAGCIPIAYDVKYGPSDIITDGRDGFLVEAGDVEALARTIQKAVGLSPERAAQMRRAARKRAADFSAPRITRQWGQVLEEAAAGHRDRTTGVSVRDSTARLSDEGGLHVEAQVESGPASAGWYLAWQARGRPTFYGRVPARLSGERLTADVPPERLSALPGGEIDLWIDAVDAGGLNRVRLCGASLTR